MENNITEQDKQLLDFYYKKKKQKKIIIGIVFAIIILVGIAFIFFHISNQTNFKLYQEEITLEYGTPYSPTAESLVDFENSKYLNKDNFEIKSSVKLEENKNYPAVGKYDIEVLNKVPVKLFNLTKEIEKKKLVTLIIKDTIAPQLEVPENIEILKGSKFDVKSYLYLFQVSDLSKTTDLEVDSSQVNVNQIGQYQIQICVEDIYGNRTEKITKCSVINDPYEEDVVPVSKQEQTTTVPPSKKNENTTSKKEKPVTKPKPSKTYKNKDFLFEDGYTMSNVADAASEYLYASGQSGKCIPLKDSEGIYIGMRVVFD